MSCTGSVTALSALWGGGGGAVLVGVWGGHFRVCTFPLSTSVLVRGQGKVQSCWLFAKMKRFCLFIFVFSLACWNLQAPVDLVTHATLLCNTLHGQTPIPTFFSWFSSLLHFPTRISLRTSYSKLCTLLEEYVDLSCPSVLTLCNNLRTGVCKRKSWSKMHARLGRVFACNKYRRPSKLLGSHIICDNNNNT